LVLEASARGGYFSVQEALRAGLTYQALDHHLRRGAIFRVSRGIYRIPFLLARPYESLTCAWLCFDDQAVVSHQSALALHGLAEMPPVHHLTTPYARWRRRRLPRDVSLYFASVSWLEMTIASGLPVTGVLRTLVDCHRSRMDPDQLDAICTAAVKSGLVDAERLAAERSAPHALRPELTFAPPERYRRRRGRRR
jgi:predicted transcriptional regulator of viral defense system